MPHQEYMRRLRKDAQHPPTSSGGAKPMMNRQRIQADEGQRKQRPSPRLGDSGDENNRKTKKTRHDSRLKVKAGSVAARALAALKDNDSDISRGEGELFSLATPDAARASATPAPESITRFSSPSRRGQTRRSDCSWEAALKQKIHNFAIHSPVSNITSRQNIAGRSPSNSIASAQTARTNNFALGPRNVGRSTPNKVIAARGMMVTLVQNTGRQPLKPEVCNPYRMNGHTIMATSDQKVARGDPGGIAPSIQGDLIDLTGDDSGEDVETLREHFASGTSKQQQSSGEKESDAMPHKENSLTTNDNVVVIQPFLRGQKQEKLSPATKARDVMLNEECESPNSHVVIPSTQRQNQEKPSKESNLRGVPLNENYRTLNNSVVVRTTAEGHNQENPRCAPRPPDALLNDNSQTLKNHVVHCPSTQGQNRVKSGTVSKDQNIALSARQSLKNRVLDHLLKQGEEKPSSALIYHEPAGNSSTAGENQTIVIRQEVNNQTENLNVADRRPNVQHSSEKRNITVSNHHSNTTIQNAPKPNLSKHEDMHEDMSGNEKQPMPMPMSHDDDTDQSVSHNVICCTSNQDHNIGQKTSSELKPQKNSAGQKKSTTSAKKKAAKKAPTKKPDGALSCSLVGTLYYSMKDGNHCHIIRGLWEYEDQAESTPQRFLLRRNIPSDVESMPLLTCGGIFDGSFVYQWAPKGQPQTYLVIKESEVNIFFTEQDPVTHSFKLHGTGQNEVGKFDLVGTARKISKRKLYDIQMHKKYTEVLPSRVPPPLPGGNEQNFMTNTTKRNCSMLDALAGSETDTSDDQGEKKDSSKEGKLPREISTSTENSHVSYESKELQFMDEGSNMEGEAMMMMSTQGSDKVIIDLVHADSVQHMDQELKGKEKYDPVSLLLSSSQYLPTSNAHTENCAPTSLGAWREFGAFQGTESSMTARALSWNVRNVKPKYTHMNLDFFSSVGIVNVQDLLEADTDTLCSLLLAFDEFKAACAFAAWRSRLNGKQDSMDGRQTFYDVYLPDSAKKSILTWKRAAESWYKKMAPAESLDRTQTNDMQVVEVASEMDEAVSDENHVQPVNTLNSEETNDTELIRTSAGTGKEKSDDLLLLKNILSLHEASALRKHCNINTARQLLRADRGEVIKQLTAIVGIKLHGRPKREVECIVEGMLHSWLLIAQEALQKLHFVTSVEENADLGAFFSDPMLRDSHASFHTPLSYVDLHFLKAQHILSDEQLVKSDPLLLAHSYVTFVGRTHKHISLTVAREVTNKWQQDARLVLGMSSKEEKFDTLGQNTRLDKDSGPRDAMFPVPNLCKTVADEENHGLPRRTIFTYDRQNHVLYEFLVSVKDSLCSADAGNGAFLTFKGAQVLKASSKWKKKSPRDIPQLPQTRRPLEALFSISGATVTLKGVNIHGDEHHYGPEKDDSVGVYREFTLDDFVEAKDNISFSSKHLGCALIELDRYAPLLPVDRKTDFCFAIKDFIFSHEPSSWRFDVQEELNGCKQVVDFTSDITGAPHDVAQSHMSMYVNEVGHNMDLVENVHCLGTSRSVSYYIHIDKPMAKGETVELLVNYKEHYETMRERRGYGKANLFEGVKSDAHNITRVLRNLEDRFLTEASILKFTEDDIRQVVELIILRVWDGVTAATSTLANRDSNLLRQCIARRRMDWLSNILRTRYYELLERRSTSWLSFLDSAYSGGCIFQKGMYVFVHDWPKNDIRPAYTGLATIMSISKDSHNRNIFEVELSDGKYIESVPEAVVTLPTDDDFKDVPKRTHSKWMKWKKEQEFPQTRDKILKGFHTIEWNGSFVRKISAEGSTGSPSEMQTSASILQSLRWEISEELLFLLVKNNRISRPFDEEIWCPLSVSLLTKCLHSVADFVLMGRDKQTLNNALKELARDAANTARHMVSNASTNQDFSLSGLAFMVKPNTPEDARVLVIESIHINRLTIDDYVKDPQPLDLEWYLTHQVILAVHSLASLIDWGLKPGTDNPLYSIKKLCDDVGLKDASYLNFYMSKVQDWRPLLCT